jgi:hypothetical protein
VTHPVVVPWHQRLVPPAASVRRVRRLTVVGLAAIGLYCIVLFQLVANSTYDIWGGVLLAPLLGLLTAPLLVQLLRSNGEPPIIIRLFLFGLVLKLLGSFARYFVVFSVFGYGDAEHYHIAGVALSPEFRHFEFGGAAWHTFMETLVGTRFINLMTGVVYTFIGPTLLGGFVVFSLLSFWGLYFFYRAFRVALPDGDSVRYLALLMILPSMLFWPSSIGKDAWMVFCLGMVAYGAARLFTTRGGGGLLLVLGLTGCAMVRPHLALIATVGLVIGSILRRSSRARRLSMARRVVTIVVVLIAGVLVVNSVQSFFGLDGGLDQGSVDSVLNETSRRSSQGGSAYDSVRPSSPVDFPWAVVTVLYRPFPFEADNVTSVIAAAEGLALLGLTLFSIRRLMTVPRRLLTDAYVSFVVCYTLVFTFAFSAVGNFGILVRQRTQLLPIFVVLLALPIKSANDIRRDRIAGRSTVAVGAAASGWPQGPASADDA